MKLRVLALTVLIFLTITVHLPIMPPLRFAFHCTPKCSRGFNSPRGLTIHQLRCSWFKEDEDGRMQELAQASQAGDEIYSTTPAAAEPTSPVIVSGINFIVSYVCNDIVPQAEVEMEDVVQPFEDDPSVPPTSPPAPPVDSVASMGRGQRSKRPTWKVLEQQQQARDRALSTPLPAPSPATPPQPIPVFEPTFQSNRTSQDRYGLYSIYNTPITTPTTSDPTLYIPPTPITFVDPASRVPTKLASQSLSATDELAERLKACSSRSAALVMQWFWERQGKSIDDCDTLVHDVILNDQLDLEDLKHFSARRETALMDKALSRNPDRWQESSVVIDVPDGRSHRGAAGQTQVPQFVVPGLMHRSITNIIRTTWSSPESADFQYVPYRQFWSAAPSGVDERVYGELYTSDAFNEAHEELQRQPPEPGCSLERVVCALMAFSDSTHLANFGDASLWPLYLYFGNQSKYRRLKPSSGSCHHTAYIPKVCRFGIASTLTTY